MSADFKQFQKDMAARNFADLRNEYNTQLKPEFAAKLSRNNDSFGEIEASILCEPHTEYYCIDSRVAVVCEMKIQRKSLVKLDFIRGLLC